jgi:hypothetical protein
MVRSGAYAAPTSPGTPRIACKRHQRHQRPAPATQWPERGFAAPPVVLFVFDHLLNPRNPRNPRITR